MIETPEWYEETLSFQLRANVRTWEKLSELGVDESTPLRLKFLYWAPGKAEAEQLHRFLRADTDYDLGIRVAADPRPGSTWTVEGRTQPVPVSHQILDDWVGWMVAAGAQEGCCRFDGWGASVPSS